MSQRQESRSVDRASSGALRAIKTQTKWRIKCASCGVYYVLTVARPSLDDCALMVSSKIKGAKEFDSLDDVLSRVENLRAIEPGFAWVAVVVCADEETAALL